MKLWNQIRIVWGFLQTVNNPKRTDLIIEAIQFFSKDPEQYPVQAIVNRAMKDDHFRSLYESGAAPYKPCLNQLSRMPNGSFGRAVHDHMYRNRIDFDTFPHMLPTSPAEFLVQKLFFDHDLYHVLLGLSTSVADELGVQGFTVAQTASPMGVFIIAGGLLNQLRADPMKAVLALDVVVRGFNAGKCARPIFGLQLHELFPLTLAEARRKLKINFEPSPLLWLPENERRNLKEAVGP